MRLRVRRFIAGLLGPSVLFLLFTWKRPAGEPVTLVLVVFACVLAHLFFWPAAIATRFVGRRLSRRSEPQLVLLMGGFSALLSFLCAVPFVYFPSDSSYGWHDVLRDSLDIA